MVEESLVIRNLHAWYGGGHALQGVSLNLKIGTMAAVVGRNGAGKSTFLKAIMGLVDNCRGSVTVGGNRVEHLPPSQRAKSGLAYIPESRGIFPSLTVLENLTVSARVQSGLWNLDKVFAQFPRLQAYPSQQLSGLLPQFLFQPLQAPLSQEARLLLAVRYRN